MGNVMSVTSMDGQYAIGDTRGIRIYIYIYIYIYTYSLAAPPYSRAAPYSCAQPYSGAPFSGPTWLLDIIESIWSSQS